MLETLRQNLKYYRTQKDLSQETLSVRCNYDKTYVGKIERGDTNPSVEAILRIANVLDVPSIKLLQREVSSEPATFQSQLDDPSTQVGNLFVDIFDNAPAISFLTGDSGEILQLNESAKKFLKADANDVIGETLSELSFWSQAGLDPSVLRDLCELGAIGKKATRRVSLRYKGQKLDLQVQVSHANSGKESENFVIFQFFLVEETLDRTLMGDHFDLLRG